MKLVYKGWIYWIVVFGLLLLWDYNRDFDSTDNANSGTRSGMSLYTDHLTGCQYLKAGWFDSLTPRYNTTGGQVGCRK